MIADYIPKSVLGINTSDATATASDILSGKSAYVNEEKIIGNCVSYTTTIDGIKQEKDLVLNSEIYNVSIPYNFYQGSVVVYDGEIHILGGNSPAQKYHYKCDHDAIWSEVSTLPYNFFQGSAVVLNNEIHILGGANNYTKHYKWNGTTWTSVSTLPYNFSQGSAVVFNNEIHILGSQDASNQTKHYKWNGSSWVSVSTLPYNFSQGSAVVFNNEIHILGSYDSSSRTKHYKWNSSTWSEVSTLPYPFYNDSAIVYNNEIHILGTAAKQNLYNLHIKWTGSSWVTDATRINFISSHSGFAVVYNNNICILGDYYTSYANRYYSNPHDLENVTSWIILTGNINTISVSSARHVNYNNEIHIFSSDSHCKLDSFGSLSAVSALPYNFNNGSAVVYNNEIHILGSQDSSSYTKHYKWNGSSWVSVSTLPYNFYNSSAVVYNNEIHILGSMDSSSRTKHYKWNGSTWSEVSTLPYNFYQGSAVVYNKEIHILGGSSNKTAHYKWNGTTWESVSTLPYQTNYNYYAVIYDDKILFKCGTYFIRWDGLSWKQTMICDFINDSGQIELLNNEIYAFGGSSRHDLIVKTTRSEYDRCKNIDFDEYSRFEQVTNKRYIIQNS